MFLWLAPGLVTLVAVACAGAGAEQPPTSVAPDVAATSAPVPGTGGEVVPGEPAAPASQPPVTSPVAATAEPSANPSPAVEPTVISTQSASPNVAPAPTPTSVPAPPPTNTPTATAPSPSAPTAIAATPVPTPTAGLPTPTPVPQLPRTTQFVPLDNPVFVSAADAPARVTPGSFVLGLDWNGERRAYPLDMMWWHHIVNDTIGGDPVLITY